MPANEVMNMLPGEAITELPVGELIEKIGIGIAEAQLSLDQMSVRVAGMMSERNIDFQGADGETRTYSLLELGFSPTFYHFTETEITVTLTLQMRVEQDFSIGGSLEFGTSKSTTDSSSISGGIGGESRAEMGMGTDAGVDASVPVDGVPLGLSGSFAQSIGLDSLLGASASAGKSSTTNKGMAFGATIDASYSRKYEFDMSGSSTVKTRLITVPPPSTFIDVVKQHARAGATMEVADDVLSTPSGGDDAPVDSGTPEEEPSSS
ncbi:MAG: hypothetical protein ACPG4N_00015 [Gammaproteobacteria bacterium]